MEGLDNCQLDILLLYEVVEDEVMQVMFPINSMRNYALLQARTPLVAMVDVDLIVSNALLQWLLDQRKCVRGSCGVRCGRVRQQRPGAAGCSQHGMPWRLPAGRVSLATGALTVAALLCAYARARPPSPSPPAPAPPTQHPSPRHEQQLPAAAADDGQRHGGGAARV
jgi:hypothetical protein